MSRRLTFLICFVVAMLVATASASAQSLVGDVSVEPSTITVTAGTPQAYPFTANYTGTVTGLDLYVAAGSTTDPPPPNGFATGGIPFTDGVNVEQEFWTYVSNGESF